MGRGRQIRHITVSLLACDKLARGPVALEAVAVLRRGDRGCIVKRMGPGVVDIGAEPFQHLLMKTELSGRVSRVGRRDELVNAGQSGVLRRIWTGAIDDLVDVENRRQFAPLAA